MNYNDYIRKLFLLKFHNHFDLREPQKVVYIDFSLVFVQEKYEKHGKSMFWSDLELFPINFYRFFNFIRRTQNIFSLRLKRVGRIQNILGPSTLQALLIESTSRARNESRTAFQNR